MIDHELLKKALAVVTAKGAEYADVFVEKAAYQMVIADDKKLRTGYFIERGVGVRAVVGGRTVYAITNSFAEQDVLRVATFVGEAIGGNRAAGNMPTLRLMAPAGTSPFDIPPAEAGTERKTDLVRRAEERAWMVPFAIQATIEYRDQQRDIILASTLHDCIASHTLGLTEFSSNLILERNGQRQSGSRGYSFYAGMEALTGEYAPERITEQAADIAGTLFAARDCPRGEMPVVFAPGGNGILFHESCGHGMEADLVEKGTTFTGKVGQSVASPLVTLIDDGTLPGYAGSFAFDDEGTPAEKTVLIENGILRGYMHSSVTARRFGVAPTGSARRESYEHPPIPRMRNTYINAGEMDAEDIIKGTKRGLYALRPGGGGQVNVTTGEFITSIKLGYMIEDGRITYPVRGASIIGRGIDALRDIDMVGNDLIIEKSSGRCGKNQQVPVGVGMPTVRVKALTVGGTGEAYVGGEK